MNLEPQHRGTSDHESMLCTTSVTENLVMVSLSYTTSIKIRVTSLESILSPYVENTVINEKDCHIKKNDFRSINHTSG